MVDWSPQLTEWFTQALMGEEELGALRTMLAEWLTTIGLVRYTGGSARPAWQAFLRGVEELAAARAALGKGE